MDGRYKNAGLKKKRQCRSGLSNGMLMVTVTPVEGLSVPTWSPPSPFLMYSVC